ncbi:MAG: GNAT family N-acetyltransferase [Ruminiclostridium sp.]|nr:GNAT family N-acetyltransferase [Ruminiclostridium sp.]
MTIRTASLHDLDAISQVESLCFPPAEAADRASIQRRLSVYPDRFWLLWEGESLAGFVNGMLTQSPDLTDEMYEDAGLHDPQGDWQMIFGVDTIPAFRRQGCAQRVLNRVIQQCREENRKGLVLTCKEHLLHYYAKFGFQNEGISASVHGNVRWYQMRLTF